MSLEIGSGDEIRTRIELNPADFKSAASHQLRHTAIYYIRPRWDRTHVSRVRIALRYDQLNYLVIYLIVETIYILSYTFILFTDRTFIERILSTSFEDSFIGLFK